MAPPLINGHLVLNDEKKETQVFKLTFYIENHLFSCVPSGEDMEKKSTASLTLHSSGCGDNINHPVCQHLCDG